MSRTTIKEEITSTIYTNTNRSVTGNALQGVLTDMVDDVYDNVSPFESGTGSNSAKQKGTGAVASGASSVAEGSGTTASGGVSHAEGSDTIASGIHSHAEGQGTMASGNGSHAEGVTYNNIDTSASADASHAEGAGVVVKGQAAHGEGLLNVAGRTQEEAVAALADFPNLGGTTKEKVSKLIGFASHSEGSSTRALGTSSHAEGNSTQALVNATHAEGDTTTASGEAAHSEGCITTASGNQAHAEGYYTEATANQSHAEGKHTKATSQNAHAEGNYTTANGNASHTEGYYTVANNSVEHAEGQYNVSIADVTRHTVGIGNSSTRKNAHTITTDGKHYIPGIGTYDGTETTLPVDQDLATIINGKASSSHTHPTTIAADNGTNQLTLLSNTKYKLTAGGSNFIFTTPTGSSDIYWVDQNTDTYNTCLTAFNNGKVLILKRKDPYDEDDLMLIGEYRHDSGFFQFSCIGVGADQIWTQKLVSGSGWGTLEYKTVGVPYPAGRYSCVKSGGSGITSAYCCNGNIIIAGSAGTYAMTLSNFYASFMKSIGGYSTERTSQSDATKIDELAFLMSNSHIIKEPAGTGSSFTRYSNSYQLAVYGSGTNIISFTFGESASGTRLLIDSNGVTITLV